MKLPMLSQALALLVNRAALAVELFERYLCGVLSIYEVHYRIEKLAATPPQPPAPKPPG